MNTQEVNEQVSEQVTTTISYFESRLPIWCSFLGKLLFCLIIYFVGKKIIKWICKLFSKFLETQKIDEAAGKFMVSILKAALMFLMIVSLAVQLGIKEASVVAILGSAGVGISLALQGGLSNLAGGVMLLLLRPFELGDYIMDGDSKVEGTVKRIDMFYTILLTIDNQKIVIPNSQLTNSTLINVTAQDKRKLEIKVGISYQSDILKAKKIIEQLLHDDPEMLTDQELVVFVDELGESSVVIGFRAWVKTENYWRAKWRMNENIKLAFDREGIEIPYNQLDVHITSNVEGEKNGL